jgi:hypothetical protein
MFASMIGRDCLGALKLLLEKSGRMSRTVSGVNGSRQKGQTTESRARGAFSTMLLQQLAQNMCPERRTVSKEFFG